MNNSESFNDTKRAVDNVDRQELANDVNGKQRSKLHDGKRGEKVYPQIVLEICREAIFEVYMCPERHTITDTLHRAIQRVLEEQSRLDRERACDHDGSHRSLLRVPTRYLITRLLGEIPEFDRDAARYGRVAARRFRWHRKLREAALLRRVEKGSVDGLPQNLAGQRGK